MPTLDQTRLQDARIHPRVLDLWFALRPLTSVVRLMNTGAHPDDEMTALLAAISLRDGINLSYACSTRGEGGQNDIGTESGAALGALRTREMERACDILNMRMYWHSTAPEDSITDFRFSKSGEETLRIWGHDRLMQRFVEIIRTDKPDIILPTFLDVPGQHGHHRAMTQAAHEVMAAAADPAFPSNLPPWQVSKLYLPAWSGAGQAYDDDLPPPPATLTVDGAGKDPMTGWSYARIGQMSRGYHRTQGMGRWIPAGPGQDWPLHLVESHVDGPDTRLASGLPTNLADLARLAPDAKDALLEAHNHIASAVAAFPQFVHVAETARLALACLDRAIPNVPADMVHRLEDKRAQLGHVLRLALGVESSARTEDIWLRPGDDTKLSLEFDAGDASDVSVEFDLPKGWDAKNGILLIAPEAHQTDPYRSTYDPSDPPAPRLMVHLGQTTVPIAFEAPPVVLPARAARITPEKALINVASGQRTIHAQISDVSPKGAPVTLDVPVGWACEAQNGGFVITVPIDVAPDLYRVGVRVDGEPARTEQQIAYDHVDVTAFAKPSKLQVRVLDVNVPTAKVGYVGSGHDAVAHWLRALGADVTDLTDAQLESESQLAAFDSIVIGIFALRFRDGLVSKMPGLHKWVEAGGTLVTLYHRPWDNWDPDTVPPKRLEIGQPSLRWRVTDAAAEVTQLAEHPVFQTPNVITKADWDGWVKERGLYFAKSWDADYAPLLSMSDPGEAPLTGSLLTAEVGQGRHTHCSLILHHQMANLVPGAFRLMANLVAPRT